MWVIIKKTGFSSTLAVPGGISGVACHHIVCIWNSSVLHIQDMFCHDVFLSQYSPDGALALSGHPTILNYDWRWSFLAKLLQCDLIGWSSHNHQQETQEVFQRLHCRSPVMEQVLVALTWWSKFCWWKYTNMLKCVPWKMVFGTHVGWGATLFLRPSFEWSWCIPCKCRNLHYSRPIESWRAALSENVRIYSKIEMDIVFWVRIVVWDHKKNCCPPTKQYIYYTAMADYVRFN